MIFDDIDIWNTSADNSGGAMYILSGTNNLLMSNIRVRNANATSDGAAFYFGGDQQDILIKSCRVEDSHSFYAGGAIYFNSGISGITINDSYFADTSASYHGGHLYFYSDTSNVVVMASNFSRGYAGEKGGSIYISEDATNFQFTNLLFKQNRAQKEGDQGAGGAIFIEKNAGIGTQTSAAQALQPVTSDMIAITSCSFIENRLNVELSEFSDVGYSTSSSRGGAVYIDSNSAIAFDDCMFSGNSNTSWGGAVCINGTYGPNWVSFKASTFTQNKVQLYGGAVASISNNTVIFDDCVFENNAANFGGGAVCVQGSQSIIELVGNVDFVMNEAAYYGGALFYKDGFSMNRTTAETKVRLVRNRATSGSAIALVGVSSSNHDGGFNTSIELVENVASFGATIFWLYEEGIVQFPPPELGTYNFMYYKNTAPYGITVGTQAVYVNMTTNYTVSVYGQDLAPTIKVLIQDYYHAQLVSDNYSYILLQDTNTTDCDVVPGAQGSLGGKTNYTVIDGAGFVNDLLAECYPGKSMMVTTYFIDPNTALEMKGLELLSGTPVDISPPETVTDMTFRLCESGETISNSECVVCPNGTYSLYFDSSIPSTTSQCRSCPAEAVACYGSTLWLKDDYWRRFPNDYKIFTCYGEFNCAGGDGTGDALCGKGYMGNMCAVCEDGYAKYGTDCNSCAVSSGYPVLIAVGILIIIFGVMVITYRTSVRELLRDVVMAVPAGLRRPMDKPGAMYTSYNELLGAWIQSRAGFIAYKMKLIVGTYQVVSQAPTALQTSMPNSFQVFTNILATVNLSPSHIIPFGCFVPFGYVEELFLETLWPLAAAGILYLMYLSGIYHLSKDNIGSAQEYMERHEGLKNKYLSYFFYVTYLVLPSVTTTVFRSFQCVNLGSSGDDDQDVDDWYLVADMSVSCQSDYYFKLLLYAIFMSIIYALVIPMLYLYMLVESKDIIMKYRGYLIMEASGVRPVSVAHGSSPSPSPSASPSPSPTSVSPLPSSSGFRGPDFPSPLMILKLERLHFLYGAYKTKFWYWDVVETYRRITLTAIVSIIAPGTTSQGCLAVLLSVAFIELYDIFQPYQVATTTSIAKLGQLQIFFTFFTVLAASADLVSYPALELMCVLLIFANVGLVGYVIRQIRMNFNDFYERHYSKSKANKRLTAQREQRTVKQIDMDHDIDVEVQTRSLTENRRNTETGNPMRESSLEMRHMSMSSVHTKNSK